MKELLLVINFILRITNTARIITLLNSLGALIKIYAICLWYIRYIFAGKIMKFVIAWVNGVAMDSETLNKSQIYVTTAGW